MTGARIDRGDLWLHCFGTGGDASEFEIDAYPHRSLVLPRLQRDLLAHAANEILADMAPPRAPLASEILRRHADSAQRSGPEEHASSSGDSELVDRGDPEAPDE